MVVQQKYNYNRYLFMFNLFQAFHSDGRTEWTAGAVNPFYRTEPLQWCVTSFCGSESTTKGRLMWKTNYDL
jgi:hypothetical protein